MDSTKLVQLDHVLHVPFIVANVMILLNVLNVIRILSCSMEAADLTVLMVILKMKEDVYLAIPRTAPLVLLTERSVLIVTDL
jgi:hypothetical protein